MICDIGLFNAARAGGGVVRAVFPGSSAADRRLETRGCESPVFLSLKGRTGDTESPASGVSTGA